jgi:uncharacterized membrane protein affecting hemolysin expression
VTCPVLLDSFLDRSIDQIKQKQNKNEFVKELLKCLITTKDASLRQLLLENNKFEHLKTHFNNLA